MINNKARHNLIDAKCRWRSDRLDGAGSFWELLGQTKVTQIRKGETQSHKAVITHEVCCLSAQLNPFTICFVKSFLTLCSPTDNFRNRWFYRSVATVHQGCFCSLQFTIVLYTIQCENFQDFCLFMADMTFECTMIQNCSKEQ